MIRQLTPQQQLALDYANNISLAANAGSGKTFVLSKRYVEIFINEDVDLNSIIAITFTDKAAGELNKKIANEVDEQLAVETDERKKKRLEKLRRELVFSNISTIHSFCIGILKEFAPEAGIDTGFSPVDQQTADEILEQTIEESFQNLIVNDQFADDLKYMIRLFGSQSAFKIALTKSIYWRRKIEKVTGEIYSKNTDEIADHFTNEFEKNFNLIFKDKIETTLNSIRKINNSVLAQNSSNKIAQSIENLLRDYDGTSSLIKQLHFLFLIRQEITTASEGSVKNRGYLNKEREKYEDEIAEIETLFVHLKGLLECDFTGKSNIELARLGKSFLNVFSYTSKLYQDKKKLRSYLDFEDILLFTRKIISEGAVQKYLGEKYKFIMIDEYQDTNELQYEIIMPILQHLHIGNLFVVGDEKQSIYMFREADLEIFDKTKKEISEAEISGKILSLPHSFRMYPQLVLFTNKLFSRLFANPETGFNEVAHSDLVCTKEISETGEAGILLADSNEGIAESELITAKILELVAKDTSIRFSDIAILCRKRDLFAELESSLIKRKIPFSIIGGKGFYQRQTIYDIYNYLLFILNPKDDSALIGILRSPFFNYSDTKLFLIAQYDGDSFYDKLKNYIADHETDSEIITRIENYCRLAISAEPYQLIRKLLLESGYWTLLASKQNSAQELANIEKLLSLAREFSKKGFKNLYDFITGLKKSIEGLEDEGQAQVTQDENSVRLMTIHQSKGLEFKAVFIYGSNAKGQEDGLKAHSIAVDKKYGLLAKVPADKNYFDNFITPPVAALYNYTVKRKNHAELKRLFYVAVTRAVKYLFISATHKEMKIIDGSFFQLLTDGFRNNLSGDQIYLADQVEFMRMKNDKYVFEKEEVQLNISIERKANEFENPLPEEKVIKEKEQLLVQKISDVPKNEIISATKISMFAQCPVKYELTYELGYPPILDLIKSQRGEFDFQPNEDDETKRFAQLRGKIIHRILSSDFQNENIDSLIRIELAREEFSPAYEELILSIKNDLANFVTSNSFAEIQSHKKYENEFEVYCKDGDNYLYGIIDRLIFEDDRLIIIDYKTDNIELPGITKRAKSYFPQLKFYAYVLSKLYPDVNSFELRLIFLKHPEEKIITSTNKTELNDFGKIISESIHNIYLQNYSPNLSHCSQCHFALEGDKCVKLFS